MSQDIERLIERLHTAGHLENRSSNLYGSSELAKLLHEAADALEALRPKIERSESIERKQVKPRRRRRRAQRGEGKT